MEREANDAKEEDDGSGTNDRRSGQRVDNRQRSGLGSASALSRLKMLERRHKLPPMPRDAEKH